MNSKAVALVAGGACCASVGLACSSGSSALEVERQQSTVVLDLPDSTHTVNVVSDGRCASIEADGVVIAEGCGYGPGRGIWAVDISPYFDSAAIIHEDTWADRNGGDAHRRVVDFIESVPSDHHLALGVADELGIVNWNGTCEIWPQAGPQALAEALRELGIDVDSLCYRSRLAAIYSDGLGVLVQDISLEGVAEVSWTFEAETPTPSDGGSDPSTTEGGSAANDAGTDGGSVAGPTDDAGPEPDAGSDAGDASDANGPCSL